MESARSLGELEGHLPSLQSTEDIASVKLSVVAKNTESSLSSNSTVHCAGADLEKNSTTSEKSGQVSDDVYNRFSQRKKREIVAIVSFAALLAPFASSSFLPSIPQISRDLGVSQVVVTYTFTVYLVVIGVAPLAWSSYSTFYGRQKIYLVSLPIFIAASIGVAESRSLVALILTRTIQGAGCSSVLAVGAGSIGDIYRPIERGRALGIFYGVALFGPALSPVIAGILTEYAHGSRGSWRAFQYLLAALGCLSFSLVIFLPETSHHRGSDALKESKKSQGKKNPWVWVWLNPLRPLKLLRYRNILVITLVSSCVLLTTYSVLTPLTITLGSRFGITNGAILGTLYLAPGIGNIVGSTISGYISDYTISRWITRRSQFVPEDRLRATIIPGLAIPLSLLGAGFSMQLWKNTAGMAVSLLFLFINGVASICVIATCNTYLVDVLQKRSAEATAVNNCLRYLAAAIASAIMLPLIQRIGIWPTNAVSASVGILGLFFTCLTIRYGKHWREKDAEKFS